MMFLLLVGQFAFLALAAAILTADPSPVWVGITVFSTAMTVITIGNYLRERP